MSNMVINNMYKCMSILFKGFRHFLSIHFKHEYYGCISFLVYNSLSLKKTKKNPTQCVFEAYDRTI